MSDMNAFTAETAQQHQAELNDYLQSKNINQLFIQIVEALLIEKPDNPIAFTVQYLQKKFPDQAVLNSAPGDPSIIEAADRGAAEANMAAEEDEKDEDSDDEDESDYVDDMTFTAKFANKGNRGKRGIVFGESANQYDSSDVKVIEKEPEIKQRILQSLAEQVLFKHLEPQQCDAIADAMEEKTFEAGDVIIQEGDDGDFFYVVTSGTVDCFKGAKKVFEYKDAGCFGELAIMYNAPRAATCKATSAVITWALERKAFKALILSTTLAKRTKYKEFLNQVDLLSEMNDLEKMTMADALVEEVFEDGAVVCRQGDKGDKFFIVKEGTALCTQTDARGAQAEVARLKTGTYFGEIALLTSKPRQATVTADGTLVALTLDRKTFTRVMGPLDSILQRNMAHYQRFKLGQI